MTMLASLSVKKEKTMILKEIFVIYNQEFL